LALALAERANGTIINADSAQVYADLRVLSARPTPQEEDRVPHRLFGYLDAAERDISAARWARDAKAAVDEAVRHGRMPILVGGTGLYLRTLLDGIAPVPEIDPAVRTAVRALSVDAAFQALRSEDAEVAAKLAPADTARISRALEVVRSTGRSIAHFREARIGGIGASIDLRAMILLPSREWLVARTDQRFEAMLGEGALDEVARLSARRDVSPDAPIMRAIGVPELRAYLSGALTRDAAAAQAQLATRRYAKRQYTWFRNQPPASWRRTMESQTYSHEVLCTTLLREERLDEL
jgi:tRNA dimethylallyltransferase